MTGTEKAALIDGTRPCNPDAIFQQLRLLDISVETVTHVPLRTVEDAKRHRAELPGAHTKNLFLRNKKGRMWLFTCLEDREFALRGLARACGAGQFSFASGDRLMQYLGILPGSVSPFSVINDRTKAVSVILDAALKTHSPLNLHPLDNTLTTTISCNDLLRFLAAVDHSPQWFDFDKFGLLED